MTEIYDTFVNHKKSQPESNSKWQDRMAFLKENKLFVFASVFGILTFAALVIGLSVARNTNSVQSEVFNWSKNK